MIHFSKQIVTEKGCLNFYFNYLLTPGKPFYHVSAVYRNKKVIILQMEISDGKWTLADREVQPDWIFTIEQDLRDAILEQKILTQ